MAFNTGVLRRVILIIISAILLPSFTFVLLVSRVISPFTQVTKHIRHHRQWRALSSSTFRPRVILVTGCGSAEGLAVVRTFYRAGHKVIGADFEPYYIPIFSRFSAAIAKFYKLPSDGMRQSGEQLAEIVQKEGVDLVVCCCNELSAVFYAQVIEHVKEVTNCKTIQFSSSLTERLLNSEYFYEETLSLGLSTSETKIEGPEYVTQSLIIYGKVLAFTSCRSQDHPVQQKALPPTSAISMAMLECTQVYAKEFGKDEAGHISLTFTLDEYNPEPDLRKKLFPSSCSPTVQPPVMLFFNDAEDLSEAYCSILPDHEPEGVTHHTNSNAILMPEPSIRIYWLQNCITTLLLVPLLDFITLRTDIWNFLASWVYFVEVVVFWKEGVFEIWDPWPAWWLYGFYQPATAFLEIFIEYS